MPDAATAAIRPTLVVCALAWAIVAAPPVGAEVRSTPTPLTTVRVASGLNRPLSVTHAPGDTQHIYILQENGVVRVLDATTNSLLPTPFIDISDRISHLAHMDAGAGGLAFDPDYQRNGYVYLSYFREPPNRSIVSRFTRSSPLAADPDSEFILLSNPQPSPLHNVGWIGFSPIDRLLYIAHGDGDYDDNGSENAQNLTNNLLGKLLRIDPHGHNGQGGAYGHPPGNPFVGVPGDDEIWAYGLRNPFRASFDPLTGDLWVGDVGQNLWEEINVLPAGGVGGENFGWDCYEGLHNFEIDQSCPPPGLVQPVHEVSHSLSCAIIMGEVYRGCAIPDLDGTLFFADFCSARIWSARWDPATNSLVDVTNRTSELAPGGGLNIRLITSFGRDALGELYLCDRGTAGNLNTTSGEVYKIVPNASRNDSNDRELPNRGGPTAPADLAAFAVSQSEISLSWSASTDPQHAIVRYIIRRDGVILDSIPAGLFTYTDWGLAESSLYAYTVAAVNCALMEGPESAAAQATTFADITPPNLTNARAFLSPSSIVVEFDEPIDQTSAESTANYALNQGITVLNATLLPDTRSINLATTPLMPDVRYRLTLNNLSDRSVAGNPIAPNSSIDIWLQRIEANQRVLYEFNEASGDVIHDSAGHPQPLNLVIANPDHVTWLPGALRFDSSTLAQTTTSASTFAEAVEDAGELTVEAWLLPSDASQTGPARIVNMAQTTTSRNFTLGQSASAYSMRLRTTATDNNGLPALNSPPGDASVALTHVLYTRNVAGEARLYINSIERAAETIAGDMSNWEPAYSLILGNEVSGDRPWLGELHLVALYDRALSPADIQQNFAVGANPQPPPVLPCHADIAPLGGDGQVSIADLLSIIAAFNVPCDACPQDIAPSGGDGTVTIADVLAALADFGPCP